MSISHSRFDNLAIPPMYTPYQNFQPWYLAPQCQHLLYPHPADPIYLHHLFNRRETNEPPIVLTPVPEFGLTSQPRQKKTPHLTGFPETYKSHALDKVKSQGAPTVFEKSTKRFRSMFTGSQLLDLEREFHTSQYPTRLKRAEIANRLKLKEKIVKVWFQNRRVRQRKNGEVTTKQDRSRVDCCCKRNNSTTNEVRSPCSTNEEKVTDVVGDSSSSVNKL